MSVQTLGRGFAWLDTGTADSMLEAANFIQTIQNQQGLMVASLEEVAFRKGWISSEQLKTVAEPMCKNSYGEYLMKLANGEIR